MPATRPLLTRFWEKVNKNGRLMPHMKTRCYEWTAATDGCGYGMIGLGPGQRGMGKTHRLAWEFKNGPISGGLCVLHKCDNPPCVRSSHLFLGDQKDNATDREKKGRGNKPVGASHWAKRKPHLVLRGIRHWTKKHPGIHRGEGNPKAKLTATIVAEIRKDYATGKYFYKDLGKKYGVDTTTVGNVVRLETWV